MLPNNTKIKWEPFKMAPIFKYIQNIGKISDKEMKQVFNCGIGMVVVMTKDDFNILKKSTLRYTVLGEVTL